MHSGSEAGSYVRLIDFVYHSTQVQEIYASTTVSEALEQHAGNETLNPKP